MCISALTAAANCKRPEPRCNRNYHLHHRCLHCCSGLLILLRLHVAQLALPILEVLAPGPQMLLGRNSRMLHGR